VPAAFETGDQVVRRTDGSEIRRNVGRAGGDDLHVPRAIEGFVGVTAIETSAALRP
jgi:hypothetical protein